MVLARNQCKPSLHKLAKRGWTYVRFLLLQTYSQSLGLESPGHDSIGTRGGAKVGPPSTSHAHLGYIACMLSLSLPVY